MYTNQVDLCKTLIKDLVAKFPDVGKDDQDLILAGVLSRSGKADEAVQLLLSSNLRYYSNQYKPGLGLNIWLKSNFGE